MIYYISIEDVVWIHDRLINEYWWLAWVKNQWQIESVLENIQNNIYYPDFLDKMNHLFFCLIMFHCFNDGNKRTAITSLAYFLELNDVYIPDILPKLEDIVIWVAKWIISKDETYKILKSMLISFEYID